jgi:hypothetical protein
VGKKSPGSLEAKATIFAARRACFYQFVKREIF